MIGFVTEMTQIPDLFPRGWAIYPVHNSVPATVIGGKLINVYPSTLPLARSFPRNFHPSRSCTPFWWGVSVPARRGRTLVLTACPCCASVVHRGALGQRA